MTGDKKLVRRCCTRECDMGTRSLILNKLNKKIPDDGKTINIGVIFYVCYSGINQTQAEAEANFTIDQLNKDFNIKASNFNSGKSVYTDANLKSTYTKYLALAGDCNLNFFSVQVFVRPLPKQTSGEIDELDRNIKNKFPPIQPERYLNVWIVDFDNGLLGYAQFPWDKPLNRDGVVIAKGTFGKNPEYTEFNLGHTLTHEIGHWLGLYHTFQDTFRYDGGNIDYSDSTSVQELKGDCVIDTPPQLDPTEGNPYDTPNSWPSSQPFDENKSFRHMYMNFMDYSDDIAMFMFTKDQADKIRQMIRLYRPRVITSGTLNEDIVAVLGFESLKLEGWNLVNIGDAEITGKGVLSGKYAFRSKRMGRAYTEVDLTDAKEATISINVNANNPETFIWVKSTDNVLYYKKLPTRKNYRRYILTLPKPYNTQSSNKYWIQVGTNSRSDTRFTYWDDFRVVGYTGTVPNNLPKTSWKRKK